MHACKLAKSAGVGGGGGTPGRDGYQTIKIAQNVVEHILVLELLEVQKNQKFAKMSSKFFFKKYKCNKHRVSTLCFDCLTK